MKRAVKDAAGTAVRAGAIALILAALSLTVCPGMAAGAAAVAPTAVRAMLSAGALELALAQVDAHQPRESAAPHWAEWEGLRCEVLARLKRGAALLERAGKIPPARPEPALNACLVHAAEAALARGDASGARAYAARLLWQRTGALGEVQAARLTVIESYLAERRGDDAFSAMLRYQQDYRPLDPAIAERFASRLLDIGNDANALNWLPASGEVTPARLRLQLRSQLLAPEAVITQARAALVRDPQPAYWRALYEGAVRARDMTLQVEALERMLQSVEAADTDAQARAAERLWQAYLDIAEAVGNREQLLMGDDGAWADYAAQRLGSAPFLARAFYAYLAQRAQNVEIRRNAQLQLAYSLYSSGLDNAALRAMQRIGYPIDTLDSETRYLLGAIAEKHNDAALALRLWEGIDNPPKLNAIEWHLTLARTALHAGDTKLAAQTMKRLLEGRSSVSRELAERTLELGQEMLDLRALDAARTAYGLLVPLSTDAHAREALFGLGRAYELAGEPVPAAAHYLRSALLVQATVPDGLAFQARLLAGLNLMRAGLRPDARAQFEWLLKNAKEPALVEAAKRALSRL